MRELKSKGRALPSADEQAAISEALLARPSPALHSYTVRGGPTVHYVARHADCLSMLTGSLSSNLSAAHYDHLMRSATGDLDFLLGEGFGEGEDKTPRWEILRLALNVAPAMDRRDGRGFLPYARPAVREAVAELRRARDDAGRFDGIEDYARTAAALAAARFTGIALPLPGKRLRKRAGRFMLMSQMVFGQAFANIGDRSQLLRLAARFSTRAFRKLIDRSLTAPADGTLLARIDAVRQTAQAELGLSDAEFDRHRTALVYEIAGTIQILVTTSFANIVEAAERSGLTLADVLARLDRKPTGEVGDIDVIDEALRHVPTTPQLYRLVERPFSFAGTDIAKGDYVCALVGAAMQDPAAFPSPQQFATPKHGAPARAHVNYLNFGPNEATPNAFRPVDGAHPCFGQYWARHLLAEMVRGIAGFEGVSATAPAKRRMGLPSSLPIVAPADAAEQAARELDPGHAQALRTVLTEIRPRAGESRGEAETAVRNHLEILNNPARPDITDALIETRCIHFCSLTVVSGRKEGEPSYLVLELSADGPEEFSLGALCDAIGDELWHAYNRAGAIGCEDDLLPHLLDRSIELAQSPWPSFLSGRARNGLGFNGTPGLSQPRIRAEDSLARSVRDILSERGSGEETPLQALRRVRARLDELSGTDRQPLWPLVDSKPPVFAEDRASPWVMPGGGDAGALATAARMAPKMFPRPLLPWFAALFLGVLALVHHILFGTPSPDCGSGCIRVPPYIGDPAPGTAIRDIRPSATRMLLVIGAAMAMALAVGLLGSGLRRALVAVRSFGFSRMGSVVWFSAAFGLVALLVSAQHVWNVIDIPALDRADLALFALPNTAWLVIGIITLAVAWWSTKARGGRLHGALFAALGTLATVTVFALAAQMQWVLFTQPEADVALRRSGASLATLIFYPALLAAGLMIAAVGVRRSWPRIGVEGKGWQTWLLGLTLGAVIYHTAFYSLDATRDALADWRSWGAKFVVLPSLIASLFVTGYAWLQRGVSGRRATVKNYVILVSALSAAIAVLFATPVWIGGRTLGVLLSAALAVPVFLIVTLAGLGALAALIRASERRNVFTDAEPNTDVIADIMARENQATVQNHMTSVVRIIPSPFRKRITLPLALRIVREGLTNHAYRPGFLGSVGTVQYARWIHLPRTNNYVFYSNYDGSFESYLEDFITKASFGMTGVWSNSVGFPDAKLLFLDGSEDGDRFKRYARGSMIPTPFWFSAYPHLSGEEIRRNALIRDGLARIDTASDAAAWLDLFGSVSRPETVIEDEKVQTMMFSGSGKLKEGVCVLVIPGADCTDAQFRDWLARAEQHVTYGDIVPKQRATYIALGKSGLARLGLGGDIGSRSRWTGSDEHAEGLAARTLFPPAFVLGMDHACRRTILGDQGEDAPEHWDWGTGDDEPAAALFLYGRGESELTALLNEHLAALAPICAPEVQHIIRFQSIGTADDGDTVSETARKERMREPFGFTDGVSQPMIRGTSQVRGRSGAKDSIHTVEPGEFILGYPDNRERFPPTPQVEAVRDLAGDLPACPDQQPLRYPKFCDTPDARRDLGRNGSFLVIRQLEQDVDCFHKTSLAMAKELCPHADPLQVAFALQAKMVGRWRDGQSLEQNPIHLSRRNGRLDLDWRLDNPPDALPENEFLFAENDPQGDLCPYGSHIRRANPRDGLDPDNPQSLAIANRHRLLRRGRSYTQTRGNREAVGTFFVCLNADIERQFEFVQQTWIGSPKFHGLNDEVDPITAQGVNRNLIGVPDSEDWTDEDLSFTIQADGREIRLEGLKKFVRVRGGGYFFLPSRGALRFLLRPS